MTVRKIFKLDDECISQIRELVQLAILTGTNVTDHFRLMRVEPSDADPASLVLTLEYKAYFKSSVEKMVAEIESIQETQRSTLATDDSKN